MAACGPPVRRGVAAVAGRLVRPFQLNSLHPGVPVPGASGPSPGFGPSFAASSPRGLNRDYLVDSASSHMLVSKIKPCMSKYKQFIL